CTGRGNVVDLRTLSSTGTTNSLTIRDTSHLEQPSAVRSNRSSVSLVTHATDVVSPRTPAREVRGSGSAARSRQGNTDLVIHNNQSARLNALADVPLTSLRPSVFLVHVSSH